MKIHRLSPIVLLFLLFLTACTSVQIQIGQSDASPGIQPAKNSTPGAQASSDENKLSQRLFAQINQNRATNHLSAYTWNAT